MMVGLGLRPRRASCPAPALGRVSVKGTLAHPREPRDVVTWSVDSCRRFDNATDEWSECWDHEVEMSGRRRQRAALESVVGRVTDICRSESETLGRGLEPIACERVDWSGCHG
jgi:hypothetical protein